MNSRRIDIEDVLASEQQRREFNRKDLADWDLVGINNTTFLEQFVFESPPDEQKLAALR